MNSAQIDKKKDAVSLNKQVNFQTTLLIII